MDICEESSRLAELIEKSILNIFVNDRDLFLDLLDEDSVLVSAGSQVFYGRTSYERWPPNPPGVVARDVRFHPLYTNQPDEATIVGTYLLSGPCIEGTVNQRVTTNLKKVDGKWKIRLSHFSNEWPKDKANTPHSIERASVAQRLQLKTKDGIAFVDPDEIIYAESHGKSCVLHLKDRTITVGLLLRDLSDLLSDQFVRTSRFYLVNALYVQSVRKDGIEFSTGEKLPIPERRVKEKQIEIGSAITRAFRQPRI